MSFSSSLEMADSKLVSQTPSVNTILHIQNRLEFIRAFSLLRAGVERNAKRRWTLTVLSRGWQHIHS